MTTLEMQEARGQAITALSTYIIESGSRQDLIAQVAGTRVSNALVENFCEPLKGSKESIAKDKAMADKAALSFGLQLEIKWDAYYRNLKWRYKRVARKHRDKWLADEATIQREAAIRAVHKIVQTNFPVAMGHPDVEAVFTKTDLLHLRAGNN